MNVSSCWFAAWLLVQSWAAEKAAPAPGRPFEIQVVDRATGRGVPLVELETVNHLRFVTDNAGRVAFNEPGLMDRPVFFHVRSHGYTYPKDGFGSAGKALIPQPGEKAQLEVDRINIAERLYRITGEGLYRDSILLGETTPLAEPLGSGKVAGQDSAGAVVYQNRIFWFWGDTAQMKYPLGHFWTAGATSARPLEGGLNPEMGVNLDYFVGEDGFSRPVARLGVKTGLIWIDGLSVVQDRNGRDRLLAHYAHMESLARKLGHGLAVFNDDTEQFERLSELELEDRWRFPRSHPIHSSENGTEYLYCGDPFPNTRVPATLEAVADPGRYEAWTCLATPNAEGIDRVQRGPTGELLYAWRTNAPPLTPLLERKLIASGAIQPEEARYQPVDVDSGERIEIHNGSVRWNEHRQRWILIAVQQGGRSFLGEVWYSESPSLTEPWSRAKKIVTHDQYSFYNPVHHSFLDQEGGRRIYFEGTYTSTFSGNPVPTPRYDYNQIMYRLDLSDPRLRAVADDAR